MLRKSKIILLLILFLMASQGSQTDNATEDTSATASNDTNSSTATNDTESSTPLVQEEPANEAAVRTQGRARGRNAETPGTNEEEQDNLSTSVLILKRGDPFFVFNVDKHGCLILGEEDIPDELHGTVTHLQKCDPWGKTPKTRCELYITDTFTKNGSSSEVEKCLKPTHQVCDESSKECVCGSEGTGIPELRFQFGTSEHGHSQTGKSGRCFIRPTFDYLHGFECAPGTVRKDIAVEEEADAIAICTCEDEKGFEKFDTSNGKWWICGSGFATRSSIYLLVFATFVNFPRLMIL